MTSKLRRDCFHSSPEPLESRIAPAAFIVTSTLDDGSAGTLRSEINAANGAPGIQHTITFAPSVHGTLVLASGQLDITSNLTIKGPGVGKFIIDGVGNSRIFDIDSHSVSISGLGMIDGTATGNGGAIFSNGSLTISKCIISGSTATSGNGGGIYDNTSGAFVLKGSVISGNKAPTTGSYRGGGAWIDAQKGITVSGSEIGGNYASYSGGGLRLYEPSAGTGNIVISGSIITGNRTGGITGGMAIVDKSTGGGQVKVSGSTITGNYTPGNWGGFYLLDESTKPAVISSVTISNNVSGGSAGGFQDAGTEAVTLQSCHITGNSAGSDGGGIVSESTGALTIAHSTVSDNKAGIDGGGVETVGGSFTLTSSVVSGNSAAAGKTSGSYYGGGLYVASGAATIKIAGSTISSNTALAVGGGADLRGNGVITISSTKVMGNVVGKGSVSGAGGGLNIRSDSTSVLLTGNTILGNSALGSDSVGGGINIAGDATFSILSGKIEGNFSGDNGGGVYVDVLPSGLIKNVLIAGNEANVAGGGIAHGEPSSGVVHIPLAERSLVTGNVALAKVDSYANFAGDFATP